MEKVRSPQIPLPNLYCKRASPNAIATDATKTKAAMLQQGNIGFSADWWSRYQALIGDRQAETLSEQRLAELDCHE